MMNDNLIKELKELATRYSGRMQEVLRMSAYVITDLELELATKNINEKADEKLTYSKGIQSQMTGRCSQYGDK